MRLIEFICVIGLCIVFSIWCAQTETMLKSLQVSQQLDQQEIKELQNALSPEFKKALVEFTDEVKTENAYLQSFEGTI